MKILLLGGPGTGKSTVGQRLAAELGWPWISSGAILRESKEPWVIEKLKTSQLFDDKMISDLVFKRLEGVRDAIIDGYPRTVRQAEMTVERGLKIELMVELTIPMEEVFARLSLRGRDQDSPEVIRERWAEYDEMKEGIMKFLEERGTRSLTIDGVGTQEEVYERVVKAIKEASSEEIFK